MLKSRLSPKLTTAVFPGRLLGVNAAGLIQDTVCRKSITKDTSEIKE